MIAPPKHWIGSYGIFHTKYEAKVDYAIKALKSPEIAFVQIWVMLSIPTFSASA